MSGIQAIVVDPGVRGRLAIRTVTAPQPAPGEALIRVIATSVNRGEALDLSSDEAGWRPGRDFAGVVEAAAENGTGPTAGTRVVGLLSERAWAGAWAEQIAVPVRWLAELPDAVSFSQAAVLPTAGLTALYALERGGGLLGRSVLITGASGGVGMFACQLARAGGAVRIVAIVRTPAHVDVVRYERYALNYLGFLHIGCILLFLKRYG